MAWLKALTAAGGAAFQAYQGENAKREEERAYREAGHRRMAAGTREVQEAVRAKAFMASRALAIAAANGGGVDNPGVVKMIGDLNAEGEYRVMSRLWVAQNDYDGMIFRADAAIRERKAIRTAGMVNALTGAVNSYFGGAQQGSSTDAGSEADLAPDQYDLSANRARYGGTGEMSINEEGRPYSPIPGYSPPKLDWRR
jgi:hypothetical protein